MNLRTFYYSLTDEQQVAYAKSIGSTTEYVRVHLIPKHRKPDRSRPLKKLQQMAAESNGKVTLDEVIAHFSDMAESAA